MAIQFRPHLRLGPDQQHVYPVMTGRLNGAFDFRPGRPIRTHSVEGYRHECVDS